MGTIDNKNLLQYLKRGDVPKVAKAFGVTRFTIYNIIKGKCFVAEIADELQKIAQQRKLDKENALNKLRGELGYEAN